MNIVTEFKKIRDIPYRIPLTPKERDDSCSGKAGKLYVLLKNAGYEARYKVCHFKWSDLLLPKEVSKTPHENESSHTYLEVKIKNKWASLDPSWDKGLKNILPVNDWDGKSDTKIAVPTIKCLSPEESAEVTQNESGLAFIEKDLRINGNFYKAFNNWLESERQRI